MQQLLMPRRIRHLHLTHPSLQLRRRQVVEGMFVYFGKTAAQVGAYEELPALDLGLNDDETKVSLGVHVAGHFFDCRDLILD